MSKIKNLGDHLARPDWARRIIAMGEAVGGAAGLVPLDVDAMSEFAMESIGLRDFGDFDGDWRARLLGLVEAIEDTARMHALGRLMTRQELMRALRTRLLLTDELKRRPAIASERIVEPIVITGPARSGTSILFELLDLDPRARAAQAWEIAHPFPTGDANRDVRIRMTECEEEFWADVQPEFAAIHELRSDLPVECIHIQMPSFSGVFWSMIAHIPGWVPDMAAAMRFHRALLQTLQHEAEPLTWVLKTPVYLAMMDQLFATYPDAWVIHTHRDPVKTAISGASTLATVRWLRSDHVDLEGIGGDGMSLLLMALMKRRQEGSLPDRIVDVHFRQLVEDPVAAIGAAYDQMGREFAGEHADAIRRYLANKPKGKFGAHAYTPEQWGFDLREIRERMRPYTDHYGIDLEP